MAEQDPLAVVLSHYFGFSEFRPLQKEIVHEVLSGRDALALLPTGGGKSLCYQLPALARPGFALVVSPLIALMKDQVDQLQAAGVSATFLNSSLDAQESRERMAAVRGGRIKLLYVAPERLLLSGFLAEIAALQPWLIAVDEAHCVSEWGHDFRPEYRRLQEVRRAIPKANVLALTATATPRVREDIAAQLLVEPKIFIGSFDRPNLTYRVAPKSKPYDQLLAYLRARPDESGIVYCQSRKTTDSLAAKLKEDGIEAAAYHAGLEGEERSSAQDAFLRDDARVVCATIAFGMGVNKPNVRFVVHYDLPKNLEGYFQETGRAGRDGLASDCLLLYSAGDVVKHRMFLEQKEDPQERQLARRQLDDVVHYAESSACRRSALLAYFGEKRHEDSCEGCDNCLTPRETFDGTLEAQKLLSCVYRIREKNGFSVGMGHVVDVLAGADTEKVRKWGHEALSTYGIGKDRPRAEWGEIGRELVRLGYLKQDSERMGVLVLTEKGRGALASRAKIELTKPRAAAPSKKAKTRAQGYIEGADEILFDRLRRWRRKVADERNVPAYVILNDATLKSLSALKPTTEDALVGVVGIGDKKRADFGAALVAEIASYLKA